MSVLDKGAVLSATATAVLSAVVVGAVNLGFDEVRRVLAERRQKASEEAGKGGSR